MNNPYLMVNYKNIEHLGVVEYTVVDMGANMEVEFAYMAALVEFDMVVDLAEIVVEEVSLMVGAGEIKVAVDSEP